tara:strand:+ start:7853 stop:8497 length:645 start_codon:yes stop_codon:yes gene_type:complete
MAVDRATVLRQQQLLDQAMQRAGNNPIEAERLSRNAILQSGLEYMRRKQQEDIASGGRARELALRKGSFDQRMRSEAERFDLQKEALAEGQKIRNIGLALNVASTLGGTALGVIGEKMKDSGAKEVPSAGKEKTSAMEALSSGAASPPEAVMRARDESAMEALRQSDRRAAEAAMQTELDMIGAEPQSETPLPASRNPLDDQIMNMINANMGVG